MILSIVTYLIIFLYGIIIGSFLNVCILRIPSGESLVTKRSHCTQCSHVLHWYDLVPLFSYLFLRGRCRYCGDKISLQYPLIEALNGVLWVLNIGICGLTLDSLVGCLMISALIVLSVIDFRTYEIPFGINVFLFVLGIIKLGLHVAAWNDYVIGFLGVSGFLLLLYVITTGKGIGGGDIKLMAVTGLILGWELSIVALFFGCLYGSVIHLIRMKVSKQGHVLAMGPYLSLGIVTALWFGEGLIERYVSFFMG